MASISSIISICVVLLATYCYSVPIGTEFEYSTVYPEFTTDKVIVERDALATEASSEETTIEPQIHIKRTKTVDHSNSDESDEFTTERSMITEVKKPKRMFEDETTSKMVERSEESEPVRTEGNEETEEKHETDTSPEKREFETVTFDITTSDVPSEESKVERDMDLDMVNTLESSTEFNSRASRVMEHESGLYSFTEPTSSFETLAHNTGLLHSRTIPESVEHKTEGTVEEDYTTFKPHY